MTRGKQVVFHVHVHAPCGDVEWTGADRMLLLRVADPDDGAEGMGESMVGESIQIL